MGKKNISKKIATKFSILLSKLINYSSIFCDNCNHKTGFTQDIDAALLTLGIGKKTKYRHTGGATTESFYHGFCDNMATQCVETQQVCLEGGSRKKTKKNKRNIDYCKSSKKKKLDCCFPDTSFKKIVEILKQKKDINFNTTSLTYLNFASKYMLKKLLKQL